jgi:signal transduction histidine kinase
VRLAAGVAVQQFAEISVHHLLSEVQVAASLEAKTRDCEFTVSPVAPNLGILADRQLINSAISNLLQNAFKFTRDHIARLAESLRRGERVLIEIEDQCGGLPAARPSRSSSAFTQHHTDKTGLGLGLSIARRAVEGSGGTLAVRDMPGLGCVFIIDLPRQDIAKAA